MHGANMKKDATILCHVSYSLFFIFNPSFDAAWSELVTVSLNKIRDMEVVRGCHPEAGLRAVEW